MCSPAQKAPRACALPRPHMDVFSSQFAPRDGDDVFHQNEVSANMVLFPEDKKNLQLLSEESKDGAVLSFVARMDEEGAVPLELIEAMFAVLCVCKSESSVDDVIEDACVRLQKKKKDKIGAKTERQAKKQKVHPQHNADMWMNMTHANVFKQVERLRNAAEGADLKKEYKQGTNPTVSHFEEHRMYLTVHQVKERDMDSPRSYFCVVLWVVLHKNFDFVGKLKRICLNPDTWRNAEITASLNNRVENNISPQENLFQVWKRVYNTQINITPGGQDIVMDVTGGCSAVFQNIDNPYSLANIANILNPLNVTKKIMSLRPRDWDADGLLEIESLDYIQQEEDGVLPSMYKACFTARQLQFERCRREIRRIKEMEKNSKKKRHGQDMGDNGDDNEEVEDDGNILDDVLDVGYEYCEGQVPSLFDIFDMGSYGTKVLVLDALTAGCKPFDDDGVARIPYAPGWVFDSFDTFQDEELVTLISDDIPRCTMRHYVDFACMSKRVQKIIAKVDIHEFKLHFGHFPSRTFSIIKNKKWGINNGDGSMIAEEGRGPPISPNEREEMFDKQEDVLSGYIFDRSYSKTYERLEKSVLAGNDDVRNNIGLLRRDVEKRFSYMRADILSKKMVAPVFESTICYTMSLDAEYLGRTREKFSSVMDGVDMSLSPFVGSDFEFFHRGLDVVMTETNAKAFKLRPANLDFLYSLFESGILWRCGTYGNWTWMGMTISVCDGAGLTECKMYNSSILPNMKKAGTSGFDFTIESYNSIRDQIQQFVPESVCRQFTDDGQRAMKVSKSTIGSIVDGFQIVHGTAIPPSSSVGTPRVFSEGCGENSGIMNALISALPRDDDAGTEQETTVDTSKNGGGVRHKSRAKPLVGSSTVVLAFGENQQTCVDYVRRKYDLMRAITVRPSSLPCQRMANMQSVRQSNVPEALYTDNVIAPPNVLYEIAPLTSNVQMVATVAGFLQKFGAIRWDIGNVVQFSMNIVKSTIDVHASSIISPIVKKHSSRKWKVAQATAGIARSVWIRTLEASIETGCLHSFDVALKVARLQACDAMHISLLSNVAMRYLTQTLDFQSLAIMRVLFEDAGIPCVSLDSAFQFVCGKEIMHGRDKEKIKDYVQKSFRAGNFAPKSEIGYGDSNNDDNVTPYVTSSRSDISRNCARMKEEINPTYNRSNTVRREESLVQNFVDCVGADLCEYSGFTEENMVTWILPALKRLTTSSFDMLGFFPGEQREKKLRRVFQNVFDNNPLRFRSLLDVERKPQLMKMCRMCNSDIAWCLYFPDALVLRAMMGEAGCDWELQVEVAKTILKRTLSNFVPYSLFPVHEATFDNCSFSRNPMQKREVIPKHTRPLSVPRSASEFLPSCGNQDGVGCLLYEDFAHMHSIMYMAKKCTKGDSTALDLSQWDFDVWWGNPGDVTPLCRYYCPQCEDSPWCSAYAKVGADNTLELVVSGSDGATERSVLGEPGCHPSRRLAQSKIFAMGWGPTFKWTRTGVIFTHEGMLSTLVPFNFDEAGEPDRELQWFNEVCFIFFVLLRARW